MTPKKLAVAVAALASLALVPVANAQTFGTNLNRPATMPHGCEAAPGTDYQGFRAYYPTGVQTCTYLSAGSLGGGETAGAPGPGVLTRVRVKAAAPTGPMQVTIVRAYRTPSVGFACCFYAAESQVFTPNPNGITTVNVGLPMRADFDANFGETVDYMALTQLGTGYPFPAYDGGVPGDINRPCSAGYFPHVRRGDERTDSFGACDFLPLLQGDFAPICNASAVRAQLADEYARGGGNCAVAVAIAGSVARASGNSARLDLTCNDPVGCAGRISLVRAGAAKRAAKKTYAKGRFLIGAGHRKQVELGLTSAGKALLEDHAKAKVLAKITLAAGSVDRVNTKIKLKR